MTMTNLSEQTIQDTLTKVEAMLRDGTAILSLERGMKDVTEVGDAWRRHEPTKGQTLTITVHGGAIRQREVA